MKPKTPRFSREGASLIKRVVRYIFRREDPDIRDRDVRIAFSDSDHDILEITVRTKLLSGSGTMNTESSLRVMIMDIARVEGKPGIKGIVFTLIPRQAPVT